MHSSLWTSTLTNNGEMDGSLLSMKQKVVSQLFLSPVSWSSFPDFPLTVYSEERATRLYTWDEIEASSWPIKWGWKGLESRTWPCHYCPQCGITFSTQWVFNKILRKVGWNTRKTMKMMENIPEFLLGRYQIGQFSISHYVEWTFCSCKFCGLSY